MTDNLSPEKAFELKPLPYHDDLSAYLEAEDPDVWAWYAKNRISDEHLDSIRFELLKSTYRIEPESQPEAYQAAKEVSHELGLDVPITIYQAQTTKGLNASIAPTLDEAHLILHGSVLSVLSASELRALFAHEFGHLLLWRNWDGRYLTTEQVMTAMTHDRQAEDPHFASARLLNLYTEIFCDRAALYMTQDPLVVTSMLLKLHTQLEDVSAQDYLRQAEEVFQKRKIKSEEVHHPEVLIRARAVKLWADKTEHANTEIASMIAGTDTIEEIDLLGQQRLAGFTRRIIDILLAPQWIQSEVVLGHARLFFHDYQPPTKLSADEQLATDIQTNDKATQDYYCYVLLDFATIDRDLENLPLAAVLVLSDQLGLKERFFEIARKELRLRKSQLDLIDDQKEKLLEKVAGKVVTQ